MYLFPLRTNRVRRTFAKTFHLHQRKNTENRHRKLLRGDKRCSSILVLLLDKQENGQQSMPTGQLQYVNIIYNLSDFMDKTLHIASEPSGIGTIKLFFKRSGINDKVLVFENTLKHASLSPIKDLNNEGLKKRSQSLEKLIGKHHFPDSHLITLQDFIKYDFDKYDNIVVWHGNDVDGRLFFYMACSLIKGQLYEADTTEIKVLFPHLEQNPFILPLACCSIDNIAVLYDKIKHISDDQKKEYALLWEKWSQSDAPIRIINKENAIQEVEEDYFDESILSNCTNEFRNVARVIGETLYDSNFLIGDSFLHIRVIDLIARKKLSAQENEKFTQEIAASNLSDKNKIVINGVNVTELRFFSIKKL